MRCRAARSVGDVNRGDEQPSRPDRLADLLEQWTMEEVEVADQVVGVGLEAQANAFELENASVDPAGDVPPRSLAHHPLDANARAVDRIDAPAALGEEKGVPASPAGQVERQPGSHAFDRRRERRRRRKVMQLLAAGELFVPALEPLVHGAQRSRGSPPYTGAMEFRPLTAADLPLIATWLARPHVVEWWDGPIVLEPGLRQCIAVLEGEPIGYAQSYQAVACHCDSWWLEVDDPGVHGIDQFLADATKLGQGLGTQMVRAFLAESFADRRITRVQADPSPANGRAIRCYKKAGFRRVREIVTPDGPALLMHRDRVSP